MSTRYEWLVAKKAAFSPLCPKEARELEALAKAGVA